jgi:O-antigen ligase
MTSFVAGTARPDAGSQPQERVAAGGGVPWLPFLPLLAIPLVGTAPETLARLIVAMEVLFLLVAVRNPLWLLGALTLSEFTIRNYYIELGGAQLSTRLFISGVALLIVLPRLSRGADLGPKARPLIVTSLAFVAVAALADFVTTDLANAFTFLRYIASGLVALVVIPLVVRSREELLRAGLIVLGVGAASAVFAVFQRFHGQGTPLLQVVPNSVVASGLVEWGGRSIGLAENPIYLTNDLLLVLCPVIAILLLRAQPERATRYLAGLLIVIVIALFFSETRSWVLSAVAALAAIAFAVRGRIGRELLILLVLGGAGFWYWADVSGSRYGEDFSEDPSAASRLVLWDAALSMAVDHPFLGVGHGRFQDLSPQYADSINPKFLEQMNAGDALGRFAPHNDFLNVWVSSGMVAVVLVCMIVGFVWRNLRRAFVATHDPMVKAISLGGLAALTAFTVNSLFHNLFDSTLTLWLLAGLSLALTNVVSREQDAGEEAEA